MRQGHNTRKVMLLAASPADFEHFMFDRLLRRGSLTTDYFRLATVNHPDLFADIQRNDIKVVVPMGPLALSKMTGEYDLKRNRGRVHPHPLGIHVVPTFAPVQLLPKRGDPDKRDPNALRNPPRYTGVWVRDVWHAIKVAEQGFSRMPVDYLLDPTPDQFQMWAGEFFNEFNGNPTLRQSWDIETPYKQEETDEEELEEKESILDGVILRVSFCYREGVAVTVPWTGAYLDTIRQLLAHPGEKVVWNGLTFDIPQVTAEPHRMVVNGMVHDGMDMFHFYESDLDKGLEFVSSMATDLLPWKHTANSNPTLYSAIDPDAALRNVNWVEGELRKQGRWDAYMNHYARLMPILIEAGNRGSYIDKEANAALKADLDAEFARLVSEAQHYVPLEVKPRKRYKRQPWDDDDPRLHHDPVENTWFWMEGARTFQPVMVLGQRKFCTVCGAEASNADHFKNSQGPPKLDKKGEPRLNKKGEPMFESVKNPCKEAGGVLEVRDCTVTEWDEILPFNPNSGAQMVAYMHHHKHPVGKGEDGQDSADADHKKFLKKTKGKNHPIYGISLDVALISKTKGTYVYKFDAQGFIHTTYVNSPSTPRLGSRAVNLQNVGKRETNPWAKKARNQIIASPGHKLVQADSSAIEAVMQGWFMGDTDYMRLASQSIHAWLCCKKLGLEFTPDNVDKVKKEHTSLYNRMKTTNYLTNFGGGPRMLHMSFPEEFPTMKTAEEAQALLYELLPTLKAFHHHVRVRAQKEGYLELPGGWGHRHAFYDVFTMGQDGQPKFGKDSKRCVAFFPQGSAGAFMRDNILLLGYGDQACEWLGIEPMGLGEGVRQWMPANFVVHDGYTLDVPLAQVDYAIDILKRVLSRPIPQMDGLRIGCEVDVGDNWGSGLELVDKVLITDATAPATSPIALVA